ncbi:MULTISPECIES: ribose-phosphate diphosphokinase [unclassified Clostridium]|uniref:ribose-phosphate diphosphokinase n=1 Tax=unclassified Clostridium TaxID=2614128 RepID=UPI003216CBBF
MISHGRNIKIFAGNSYPELAADIANRLGLSVGESQVTTFSDGEIAVNIGETVRGLDVFVIQPTSAPVNNNLMELLIMIDALKRASAGRITAVIPYYGYARQDRKAKARDPITAKLVADLITAAGADRVLTMDLHAAQIQGYFNIPVDNLVGSPILSDYFIEKGFKDCDDVVVVSPDLGSVTRARKFADKLNAPIAIIDKRRPKANVAEVMNIIGEVKGKKVILIDDMIDTAGTICNGANALVKMGATEVYACCSHAVLSGPAIERLEASVIKELVMLDSIHLSQEKMLDKIKILSIAPLFAEAIRRIYEEVSVSKLFDE